MTKPVEVNGVTIGNGLPKICVPLTGKKREELLAVSYTHLTLPTNSRV